MGFASQTEQWSEKALAKLELAFRKISLDAFSRVVQMSPVDTGRFRGNWQVSIGAISSDQISESFVDPSGTSVISAIGTAIAELKVGDSIYLTNNLPYARRLEYGWSGQAPNGMVRIVAAQFQPIVDKVVEQVRGS